MVALSQAPATRRALFELGKNSNSENKKAHLKSRLSNY
jgi:hypothetical protein